MGGPHHQHHRLAGINDSVFGKIDNNDYLGDGEVRYRD
jgi:hypothetical protein